MADPAFPNLPNATAFPGIDNVNVYRYENTFDYSRWGTDTVFKCMNVPWCSDYENVVDFGSETARDIWFDAQSADVFSMQTMFHVKPTLSIKLPIPVGVLTKYNYLMVRLPTPTSDAAPIAYERTTNRTGRFFFFIMDAVQVAPSTTLAELQLDVWTTYRYDVEFASCILERGHAPVAESDVDMYLTSPIDHCEYLTADDVNYGGDPVRTRSQAATLVNDPANSDAYAIFLSNCGYNQATWPDGDNPALPANFYNMTQGVLAPNAWAIDLSDMYTFLQNVDSQAPQFKASVLGVLFVEKSLVTLRTDQVMTVAGSKLYLVDSAQKSVELEMGSLSIGDFDYPDNVARYTKLYTWPYSCVRVSDGRGNENIVRIEDTSGTIELSYTLSLIAGAVKIDGYLVNVAGSPINTPWHTADQTRQFRWGGDWMGNLMTWDVPVMQVTLVGRVDASWKSVYIRRHQQLAATNRRANANATATTDQSTANRSAATAESNVNTINAAQVTVTARNVTLANNVQQNAAVHQNNIVERQNSSIDSMTSLNNGLQATIGSTGVDANQMTAISDIGAAIVGGVAGAAAGGAAAVLTGGTAIPVMAGALVGSVPSLLTSTVDATSSSYIAMTHNEQIQTALSTANTLKAAEKKLVNNYVNAQQQTHTEYATNQQNDASTDNTATMTNASNTTADATHSTATTNASEIYNTAVANAQRDYETALDAIVAQLNQDSAKPAEAYGTPANLEYAGIRPQAAFVEVMTQNDGAIRAAGSQFARYGYYLHQYWGINDTLQVMDHFTYWKCETIWFTGPGSAVERAQTTLKDIMVRGVTVWSDPDDIGAVSVYDNFSS